MSNVLSSVPLVRVKFKRTVNNISVSPDSVTAEPTVPYLTAPGQHGFIDLVTVISSIDPTDATTGYLDLVATDDPDVLEQFGWTIRFLNSTRPTRVVQVPQSGPGVTTITDFGQSMPSVWLDNLASFTGPSGAVGSDLATRGYVDDSLDTHEAAPDPHPGYALDSDLAAIHQVPAGGSTGQALVKTSNVDYAVTWGAGSGSSVAKGQLQYLSTFGNSPSSSAALNSAYALPAANNGIAVKIKPFRNTVVGFLEWISVTVSGNYDIGIVDVGGNRLWSKGSTAWPAAGLVVETVNPTVALLADTDYWLIHSADNITASLRGNTLYSADQLRLLDGSYAARTVSSGFPIAATVTLGSTGATRLPFIVARET